MRRNLSCPNKRITKHGFTLLETLLSVALLLIITLIVYQGFMSTLKLSTNTANYQKSANAANSTANLALANPNTASGSATTIAFIPPVGLGSGTILLPVNATGVYPVPPTVMDAEDDSGLVTTHRYAFSYISPAPGP